jgi:hypothetical protein
VATFIKRNFSQILLLVFTALILLLPIILSLGSQTTNQRFAETSIFSDLAVIEQSNQLKDLADNVWWSKIIYHRYLLFGREVMVNFLSHFRADFLFISGDANPRHSIQYLGQLYYLDALFLLIGVYGLIKRRSVAGMLLLFWLVIGIFPASITKASPHALRILPTLPVFMILVGAGILSFWDWLKRQQLSQTWPSLPTLVASLILLAYLSQLAMFWRFYSKIYPVEYSQEWQYGYQQMVASLQAVQETNPQLPVFVSRELGRPAMYYWFYSQTDPAVVQAESQTATKDQSEFLTFANLTFFTKTDQVMAPAIVASTDQTFQQLSTTYQVTQLETVTDLQQRRVWIIYLVE